LLRLRIQATRFYREFGKSGHFLASAIAAQSSDPDNGPPFLLFLLLLLLIIFLLLILLLLFLLRPLDDKAAAYPVCTA